MNLEYIKCNACGNYKSRSKKYSPYGFDEFEYFCTNRFCPNYEIKEYNEHVSQAAADHAMDIEVD